MGKRKRKKQPRAVLVTYFPRFDARTEEYTCPVFDASLFDPTAASPLTFTVEFSEDQPTWGPLEPT